MDLSTLKHFTIACSENYLTLIPSLVIIYISSSGGCSGSSRGSGGGGGGGR